jgi:hypothetical protein
MTQAVSTNPKILEVDQTKQCKVTNSCGADVAVALPLSSAETQSANSIVSFNKDFEILPVAGGGTTIKNGSSDTVTLDRTHKDTNGKDVYSLGYDLLISTSNWLVPIANFGVVQHFTADPPYFKDQAVTADNKKAMQQTSDFFQTISAYPNSQLAKDYIAAMSNTDKDASSKADGSASSASAVGDAVSDGVDAFFKSTKQYQLVTLEQLVAVESYYNKFPFAWAEYADSASYYLYSSDSKTTIFEGTLSLKKTGAIDITKPNGGYTCQFNPSVTPSDTSKIDVDTTKAITLTYTDGLFVDDINSDVPGIAIKGTFQLKRTFTKNPADTKIISILAGNINGAIAVGFDSSQATTPDDTTQDWLNSLFRPKTAAQIFSSVMTILGALMMLHFIGSTLYSIGNWIKEKIEAKEPVDKEDLDEEKSGVEEEFKSDAGKSMNKLSRGKQQLPNDSDEALSEAAAEKQNLSNEVSRAKAETNVDKIANNLEDLEEFTADNASLQERVESAAGELKDAFDGISNVDVQDLKAALTEFRTKLDTLTEKMIQLNTDVQKIVNEEQKAKIDENIEDMNEVTNEVKNDGTTGENEDGDVTDTDPPADGIDLPLDI